MNKAKRREPPKKVKKVEMVYPKCPGCGHNYFDAAKRPLNKDGTYPKLGLCEWCVEEQRDNELRGSKGDDHFYIGGDGPYLG